MWHPFLGLSPVTLQWLLFFLAVAAGVCFLLLMSLGRQLRTHHAPHGMVSLQLAENGAMGRQVVGSWGEAERDAAHRSLCLDYLFIPLYTTALAVLSVLAARGFASSGWTGMASAAVLMAWGHWLVGLFDIAETSALLRTLQLSPDIPDSLARFTIWCSRVKFLFVMLAVLYVVFGLLHGLNV